MAVNGPAQGAKPSQGTTGIATDAALGGGTEKTLADMINERDD